MTLVIINTKTNKTSCYYNLYYIENNNLIPIGFSGLETDYSEIQENKKHLKDRTFTYKSTHYNPYGVPVDIVRALKDKFDTFQYIDDTYNGVSNHITAKFLNEYRYY